MASASDVRAGAAYYELYGKDGLTPVLNRARAQVQVFGQFLSGFNPGAGGTGFLNRIVFGAKEFDAKTKEYVGRVGGLAAPLRAALGKVGSGLGAALGRVFDSGAGGKGIINRALFGQKETDPAGAYVGRTGGLVALAQSLGTAFRAAGNNVRALASGLGQVGAAAGGLGAALGGPLLALFKGGFDRGAELANLSRQYGLPIQALNKLKYAADAAGVSLDEVGQDRTGRYGDLIAQAPPIDPADARAAADAQRAAAAATRSLQDALLPLVQTVGPWLRQAATWVKDNRELVAVLVPVAAGLAAVGAAAGGTALALAALGYVGGIALAVVKGAVVALLSPIGLAAAAAAGLGYLFVRYTDTGRDFAAGVAGALRSELAPAAETARRSVLGIGAALAKGDLEGALEVATAGMEAVWTDLLVKFERGWAGFKSVFVDGWHSITGGLGPILAGVWDDVSGLFAKIYRGWVGFGRAVRAAGEDVWQAIRDPVMRAVEFVKPVAAVLFAPFVASAALIEVLWNDLDRNILVNLNNLAAWVERIYARISATVENAFKGVARTALDTVVAAADKLAALDFTGALKKGIDEAKKFKEAIGGDRDADAEAKGIDARRDEREAKIRADLKARADADAAERAADVGRAEGERTAAQDRLEAALRNAAAPRAGSPEAVLPPVREGLLGTIGVKGTFGGAALGQQLGTGDAVNRQTELLKQLVDRTGQLPEQIGIEVGKNVRMPAVR